jgi:hypothetical protein
MTAHRLFAPAMAIVAMALVSPSLAEECQAFAPPTQSNGILAELAFYDFGEHMELQVNTPTQPSGLAFEVQIDGEDRPDIVLMPGLDDVLLSFTPISGEMAIDLSFLSTIVAGTTLQITGYRGGTIEALASYDLADLSIALTQCGII